VGSPTWRPARSARVRPQGLDGIIIDDARYDAAFAYSEALAASADRFDLFFWGLPPQFLFGVASSSS